MSVLQNIIKRGLALSWSEFLAARYLAGDGEDFDQSVFLWGAWLTKAAGSGNTIVEPKHFLTESDRIITEELNSGQLNKEEAATLKDFIADNVAALPKLLQSKPKVFTELTDDPDAVTSAVPVLVNRDGKKLQLYLNRVYDLEARLIECLKHSIDYSGSLSLEKKVLNRIRRDLFKAMAPFELNSQQAAAWTRAMDSNFLVVCGGPGTGKTTLIVSILRGLILAQNRLNIAVCAPTGRAVFRVRESITDSVKRFPLMGVLADQFLGDIKYATIHRLLGLGFDRQIRAKYNRLNPLPYDVILLDEASMVDLELLTYFLEAKSKTTKLIVLGDPEQLPSVGMGTVLKDLTDTTGSRSHILKKSIVRLTESHRAEGILEHLTAAMASKDSVLFEDLVNRNDPALQLFDTQSTEDFSLEEYLNEYYPLNDWVQNASVAVSVNNEAGWCKQAEALLSALTEKILLTPFRRGEWGSAEINEYYVHRYQNRFRQNLDLLPGMPVMVTQNDYDLGLFNGDRGFVMSFNGELNAVFPSQSEESPFKTVRLERLLHCDAAFAMTVHKSQGSEFACVSFLVAPGRETNVYRELSYTALTRAKQKIQFVGQSDELWPMLIRPNSRLSALSARLRKA